MGRESGERQESRSLLGSVAAWKQLSHRSTVPVPYFAALGAAALLLLLEKRPESNN